MATEKRLGGPGSKTRPKMEFARTPSVSLGGNATTTGLERVIGLDAGMDATLALRAPPGGPDRGEVDIWFDPGPPPAMPKEPEGVWPFGLSRITGFAIARDRASLEGFSTLRFPPRVGIYKHELLEWLDAIEAYEAANK